MAVQSLTQKVLRAMFGRKLTLTFVTLMGVGLMTWATTTAWVSQQDEPPISATADAVAHRAAAAPHPQPEPDRFDAAGTFPVHGRVLDPSGKPVANAEILVRHEVNWDRPHDELAIRRRPIRVTSSNADGSFGFELDKGASDSTSGDDPAWHKAQIAAVAPGLGPAWIHVEALLLGGETTLPMVSDDVPIRGRLLDSQGRPAAGVTVRVEEILATRSGADLDSMLASGQVDYDVIGGRSFFEPTWLGRKGTWTTDADGRFEVKGIGRDRIACLEFESPTLEHAALCAMARSSSTMTRPRPRPNQRSQILRFPAPRLVASTFEDVLAPCKPITGTVRHKISGKPLPGVRIVGYGLTTRVRVEATTNRDGRFRLVGLPKSRSYEIRAEPRTGVDAFLGKSIRLTDTAGLDPIETTIELPPGIIVTGRLIDTANGSFVQVSELRYQRLATNRNEGDTATGHSKTTDPTFRITVPPGEGLIVTNARGWEMPYTRARLRPADEEKLGGEDEFARYYSRYQAYCVVDVPATADSFTVDIHLTRGLTRQGKVIGPEGQPIKGARCYGVRPTWGYIKTLADDSFEILGLEPGHPRIVIFADQSRRLVGSVVINDQNLKTTLPLVVQLLPSGSIKGRLVDQDGLPVAKARLGVLTYDLDGVNLPPGANHGGSYCLWPDGEIFISGSDGRFQIDGLKPGVESSLNIENAVRPVHYLSVDELLRNAALKHGEVRDVGDVTIK